MDAMSIGRRGRAPRPAPPSHWRLLLVLVATVLMSVWSLTHGQVVFRGNVAIPQPATGGERLHALVLWAGEEPVDALERLRREHGLDRRWRQHLLAQLCAQPRVTCHRQHALAYTTRVQDAAGRVLGVLEIPEDTEPVDALAGFVLQHRIPREHRDHLLRALCQSPQLRCTRTKSRIFQQQVNGEGGETIGTVDIYDDTEPVDQIHRFVVEHRLPQGATDQLAGVICGHVPCERRRPMVYSRLVMHGDTEIVGRLEIPLGEEPADAVLAFARHLGLDKGFRQRLLASVCGEPFVTCRRRAPLVFQAPIVVDDSGVPVGMLQVQEDEELADAVYRFARGANITDDLRLDLLRRLCGQSGIVCTRGQALLRSLPVRGGPENQLLGVIKVFEGQEPADVAFAFAQEHGLSADDANSLVDNLCGLVLPGSSSPAPAPVDESEPPLLRCSRFAPVVFAVPVAAQNGSRLGVLEILHGDEPADAIARFGNAHGLGPEEKANLLEPICAASGLPCARRQGLIYQAVYTLPSGQRERLDFYDGQEPTDVIHHYGTLRNLTFRERKRFLIDVCNEPRGRPNCTRAEPMLVSIPVWETADKKMGDLEVLEGQEPIDMVYAFLEKHDLFQTAPLNTSLLEIVCNSTRVTCTRDRPRRILFSMQATFAGISHTLQYVQPESDWQCTAHHGGQRCEHYVEVLSREFCRTHLWEWGGCEPRILEALRAQLEFYEERMWRGKDLYAKLGLVRTATRDEIDVAYNRLVKRFNNDTEPQKYEKLREAYRTLSDPEEKYFYDLPCLKLFGLCGKKKKDGSISISAD